MTACEAFGARLKAKRAHSRGTPEEFSQLDVAAALQVSQSYVSIMERGLKDFYDMHPRKVLRMLRAYKFGDTEIAEIANEFGLELPVGVDFSGHVELGSLSSVVTVPIFPVGTRFDEWQIPCGHFNFPEAALTTQDQLYGLLMTDNDMAPYLPKGSHAIVTLSGAECGASGDICPVLINNIVCIRRIILHRNRVAFTETLNPDAGENFQPVHDAEVLGRITMRLLTA